MIAANALNEGTTQPYEDPIAEDHYQQQQHSDEGYIERTTTGRSVRSGNGAPVNDLEKQTTRRSVRSGKAVSVNNVAAIPNGGTKAWLQVLGAFTLFFNSWGISEDNFLEQQREQRAKLSRSQHFWRIPDLLSVRHPLFFVTLGHLMDRISTSILTNACWCVDGANL